MYVFSFIEAFFSIFLLDLFKKPKKSNKDEKLIFQFPSLSKDVPDSLNLVIFIRS